jgi:glucose-6-phosphate-specific signal transduction histidine kinase
MTTLAVLSIIALIAVVVPLAIGLWLARRFARRLGSSAAFWRARLIGFRGSFLPPGPRRDVIALRRSLQHELCCTREMLSQAPDGQIFRADARTVLDELTAAGTALDTDLRNIERFADPGQQRAALASVAPQVQQLISTSYSARRTILQTAAEDRDRDLNSLSAYVAQQAEAAAIYQRVRHEPMI